LNSHEQLQGVWQAISATVSGQEIPATDVSAIRLTLTATRFTTRRGDEILFDSSYIADSSKSPMEIQMLGTEGDFKGKPALGIFALEADTLQLCYTMPGFVRPTDFSSPPGSGAFLIHLRRVS
jgi:uncharacterized protein (TIGR03067 family)